ncbi:MAG: nucleotide exchange factor GrpE [Bacteroidales bacterium]|nr:nucleotide exchange factor GrpE [Bacteroidales bacterium]
MDNNVEKDEMEEAQQNVDAGIDFETQQESNPESDSESQTQSEENVTENEQNETEPTAEEKEKTSFFGRKSAKEVQKLKTELEETNNKLQTLNDKFLRLYSEFDNYKKRTNREKLDLLASASENVLVNILPVIDDFERAIAANEKTEDLQAVKDGFMLIYNKMLSLLKSFDVTEIEAIDTEFNTDFHEAVTHFPTEDESKKGKVIDVVQKGYKLKDKVIRFSKVVVAN